MRAITALRKFLPSRDAVQLISARFSVKPVLLLLRSLARVFSSSARFRLVYVRLLFAANSPGRWPSVIGALVKATD